ncbi:cation diffusion facilitator family transporter [Oesophagostomum dentatum]|uniref:Cation diffusion facilitator family transporter n=1 Tax=Oesophagostomum dentatum TaxID=61180 RepID=A0A0B1TRL8_OESDE|nr:cation diffusion facilitator family transporter [Oesophagostomum dentatum]
MEVADVIRAVCAIHDVSTSNQDRLKCTQTVEEFKEGPPELLASVAFQLISDSTVILRHTGWTLLEDLIRYKWNSVTSEFRVELRNRVFQTVEASVSEDTIEPCARCVVAMMEHEWPQNWPELNTQLQQMSTQGSLPCAIVFAILRRLVENVVTLASVANQRRRKDMHTAIVSCYRMLLVIFANCVVLVSLEQQLPHIVDVAVRYLSTAERSIYEQAAQCLVAIAVRKREKQDHSVVISAFFRAEVFSAILTTTSVSVLVTEIEWEGMQRFARNLVQVAYDKDFAETEKERLVKMRDTLVNAMENTSDGDILNEMLSLHSTFLNSYAGDFEKLSKYFTILRRGLLVLTGNKALNRHVVSLILRAVQAFPDFFKNHVASIVSLYNEVSEVISKMQLAHLMHVLAVLSDSVDDVQVRLELLRMAAGSSIEYMSSNALYVIIFLQTLCFEDVSAFIRFNAFDSPPSGVSDSPVTANRIELRRALTSLQGVVQLVSSSSELGSMLIPVYPYLFKLTRCLMEMHLKQNRILFHPKLREDLTKMMDTERQQIYCSVGENIEVVPNRSTAVELDPTGIERQYVHDLHDQA